MLPTRTVRLQLGELLAADATTLAPVAAANKIALVMAAFVPSETLVIGDLTLATFDGSTAKAGAVGTQQVGNSPATGDQIITITEPIGGWRWETTGTTNLPQTIFGYALINDAANALFGTALLDEPLTLQETGQEINLGAVQMTLVLEPIS